MKRRLLCFCSHKCFSFLVDSSDQRHPKTKPESSGFSLAAFACSKGTARAKWQQRFFNQLWKANDEECLRNRLRHCLRTISETVLERGYFGKAKLAQFSVIGIFALKPLTGTAGMPLGTITGGKDRNNRGRCEH